MNFIGCDFIYEADLFLSCDIYILKVLLVFFQIEFHGILRFFKNLRDLNGEKGERERKVTQIKTKFEKS